MHIKRVKIFNLFLDANKNVIDLITILLSFVNNYLLILFGVILFILKKETFILIIQKNIQICPRKFTIKIWNFSSALKTMLHINYSRKKVASYKVFCCSNRLFWKNVYSLLHTSYFPLFMVLAPKLWAGPLAPSFSAHAPNENLSTFLQKCFSI